jgi:hypothetical protein
MGAAIIFGLAATATAAAQQPAPAADPQARAAMHSFGRCVAEQSPEYAAETLAMNFQSAVYRQRLRRLADNNQHCFKRGVMRAGSLAFAGAVAERLLSRDNEPLNRRLARAAGQAPATTWSPSDAAAACVVRSVPDDVAALFATDVASKAEARIAGGLGALLSRCTRGGQTIEASPAGLRAMLATAAFRSVYKAAPAQNTGN